MLVSQSEITKYIPHRAPVVLVDELLSVTEDFAEAVYTVSESCPFLTDGHLNEGGLIESIAQSVALAVGFKNKDSEPKLGFIGGIKKIAVSAFPQLGDEIVLQTKVKSEVLNIKVVNGEVFLNQQLIASCEMKLIIQE